jgi:hypothetical protein
VLRVDKPGGPALPVAEAPAVKGDALVSFGFPDYMRLTTVAGDHDGRGSADSSTPGISARDQRG